MINLPANDHGAIYVLELNRPDPDGLADKTIVAITDVFGAVDINTQYVDIITPGMLTDMTLPDLIRNGYDMPVSTAQADALRGLAGTVVLVMSAAFGSSARTVDLSDGVRLVTTLRDPAKITPSSPIVSKSAEGSVPTGQTARKKPSDAAMSGRIATYALLVLFALVGVMIWIAG